MNKDIISKELLSEIYAFKVQRIIDIGIDDVTYQIDFNGLRRGRKYDIINIYELAHKCKEWAYNKGYCILSSFAYTQLENDDEQIMLTFGTRFQDIEVNSEAEAIFKACQWILENEGKNER